MKLIFIRLFLTLGLCVSTFELHAMTTREDQIINSEGKPVELKAVNWFGFNNQATMVNGLWGSDTMAVDFATVVHRMQLLGFNAVRLPFSFKDLELQTQNYLVHVAPPSLKEIQASVTNPSFPISGKKKIPSLVSSPARKAGLSNDYLPHDTTLNRFLWVVNFFAKNGFYVLVDNHLREDQTVLENHKKWVQDWVKLVAAISEDPVSRKMLMIDILNEPDNFGLRWESSGGRPALKKLYLSAMDALYPINPEALFFIEGTGQGGIGANWGDGFATDQNLIAQNGLSDPNPFFQALLQKPYVNQVVISPHVYPPSVTGASTNYTGKGLWNRMTASFGYLTQQGYCDGKGNCKVFPIAIGEFGSRFTENKDIQSMQDIAAYFNNTGAAADGKHRAIPNWFYWCWNANSGDTGGIVTDNWRDIIWQKVDYLTTIGLTPWYKSSAKPKFGNLCVSVRPVSGLSEADLKTVAVGSYSFNTTNFDAPVCETVEVGTYTISAPTIMRESEQFDAEPQTVTVLEGETSTAEITYTATEMTQGTFTVVVKIGSAWSEDQSSGVYKNVVNLYVTNESDEAVQAPWTIAFSNNAYVGVDSYWNVSSATANNGTVTATINEEWEALSANKGNTINLGMVVSSHSQDFEPTSITINGNPARIEIGQ